jgi:hypothetical protein
MFNNNIYEFEIQQYVFEIKKSSSSIQPIISNVKKEKTKGESGTTDGNENEYGNENEKIEIKSPYDKEIELILE